MKSSRGRIPVAAHSRGYPRKLYAGPYSTGGDAAPDYDFSAGAEPERVKVKGDRRPPLGEREPATRARSYSGEGMSEPLPRPGVGFGGGSMYRPAPPRSGGKRY